MIAKTRPSVETFYETRMGVGYQINPEWSTNFGYYYTVNYIPKLISDPQYGKSYNLVRSYATAGVKYRKDRTFIEAAIEYGGLRDSVTIRPSSAGTPIATLDQFKDYSLSVRVGTQF
ncbi:hypothetical protein EBR96_04195 [bacterium]|nr:hypothetical protein [bacterium]